MIGVFMKDRKDRQVVIRYPQTYLDALDRVTARLLMVPEREREMPNVSRSNLMRRALAEFLARHGEPIPIEEEAAE